MRESQRQVGRAICSDAQEFPVAGGFQMSKFEFHSYAKCENHNERILFIRGFMNSI